MKKNRMEWAKIEEVLTNDQVSTDKQLIVFFVAKGFDTKEARTIVAQRGDYAPEFV